MQAPMSMQPREGALHLRDGTRLAYVRYRREEGAGSTACVLAVHGWQDSAASFARVAPYLVSPTTTPRALPPDADATPVDPRFVYDSGAISASSTAPAATTTLPLTDTADVVAGFSSLAIDFVAIELAGHGRSSFLAPPAPYTQALHCLHLLEAIERLGWREHGVHIVSHSMGGGICSLFAASYPDLVLSLVMIESTGIWSHPPSFLVTAMQTLGKTVVRNVQAEAAAGAGANAAGAGARAKVYPTVDAAGERYRRFNPDISSAGLRTLMERNLRPADGNGDDGGGSGGAGYVFARDPRLNSSSFVFYTEDTILHMMKQIACPVLFVVADSVTRRNARKAARKSLRASSSGSGDEHARESPTKSASKIASATSSSTSGNSHVVRANDSVERHVGSLDRAFRSFPDRVQVMQHAHVCFVDGGHHIHLDQPEAVSRAIHTFYSVERQRGRLRWEVPSAKAAADSTQAAPRARL